MALYVGLNSGTSMDAVDAALVELGRAGRPSLRSSHSHPIPPDIRDELRAVVLQRFDHPHQVWTLDHRLGELFAEAAITLLEQAGVASAAVRAIGSHGQTIAHYPQDRYPYTVQIGDPNIIAERTGITTVADFRRRDMAAGGEGAPLAPAFHCEFLSQPRVGRVIVNIGGIANLTILPADTTQAAIGFDSGPGNTLMDVWAERHLQATMDAGGAWAAEGAVDETLLAMLEQDRYFAAPAPKSTGREHFNLRWLDERLAKHAATPAPRDVQRTLCELTASTIARGINEHPAPCDEVYVCGGGAHNPTLMHALAARLAPRRLGTTARLGVDPDWVEAAAFAWLAHRALEHEPGNLPSVTGARHAVVLGAIYPAGPSP